jgi:hypothetical protein
LSSIGTIIFTLTGLLLLSVLPLFVVSFLRLDASLLALVVSLASVANDVTCGFEYKL